MQVRRLRDKQTIEFKDLEDDENVYKFNSILIEE